LVEVLVENSCVHFHAIVGVARSTRPTELQCLLELSLAKHLHEHQTFSRKITS
jgi:hypothetical protein